MKYINGEYRFTNDEESACFEKAHEIVEDRAHGWPRCFVIDYPNGFSIQKYRPGDVHENWEVIEIKSDATARMDRVIERYHSLGDAIDRNDWYDAIWCIHSLQTQIEYADFLADFGLELVWEGVTQRLRKIGSA